MRFRCRSFHQSFYSIAGSDQLGSQLIYDDGSNMAVWQVRLVFPPKSFHEGGLDLLNRDVRAGLADFLAPVDHLDDVC